MKSYTDLEQSKKLAEILPLESADMYWQSNLNGSDRRLLLAMGEEEHFNIEINFEHCDIGDYDIPAWSLASLLEIIPGCELSKSVDDIGKWEASAWKDPDLELLMRVEGFDKPIDACYEMILKLHDLNLL